jgi:hypothetical protein
LRSILSSFRILVLVLEMSLLLRPPLSEIDLQGFGAKNAIDISLEKVSREIHCGVAERAPYLQWCRLCWLS